MIILKILAILKILTLKILTESHFCFPDTLTHRELLFL